MSRARRQLSPRELAFVGIFLPVRATAGTKVRDLPSLTSAWENDVQGSASDAVILRAMLALGMAHERLEFLG